MNWNWLYHWIGFVVVWFLIVITGIFFLGIIGLKFCKYFFWNKKREVKIKI